MYNATPKVNRLRLIPVVILGLVLSSPVLAEAPEHFSNPTENINPDPNHVPGEWPFPDPFEATTIYQTKKKELSAAFSPDDAENLFLLGIGEISFTTLKNETATVTGYFRNYAGAVRMAKKGPETVEVLVDINSIDTGVPGRNNRILDLFFQSQKAEFGTAVLRFDRFYLRGKSRKKLEDGKVHPIEAAGVITLNGVTRPIAAALEIQKAKGAWVVKSPTPIELLISDFAFGNRVYELMKSCNHKSLGNRVKVSVELYFR